MAAEALAIENMPRWTATHARNAWRQLMLKVQSAGGVAITNHDKIEIVVLSADDYNRLIASMDADKQAMLDRLTARFDASLVSLNEPGVAHKAKRLLAAKGRIRHAPKAGKTF